MNYTTENDNQKRELINKKIQKDLDFISSKVSLLLGERLHSLLLCGSFGRGEGSVVVSENYVHIVNDYDFTVVINSKNKFQYLKIYKDIHGPLERLASELSNILGIKQVDLSPKPLTYFYREKNLKIENYEVKKGHVLVYGKEDPTLFMPAWKSEDIPLFEGTWLFRNRGAGLLLAGLYFSSGRKLTESQTENFIIECNKACLAIGDSILLLKNRYHHLYSEREKIINDLDVSDIPQGEELIKLYRKALKHKLSPEFINYSSGSLENLWFEISEKFSIFFRFYEQFRLGAEFNGWIEYAEIEKPESRIDMKAFAGKILRLPKEGFSFRKTIDIYYKSKKSYTISLTALVLFSIMKNGFKAEMLNAASKILGVTLQSNPREAWIQLAKIVLNEIHPGGEAGRVIEAF